jgi:hypothetical protein
MSMRRAAFAFVAALALTGSALAVGDECQEPYGPVLPDAATTTKAELRAIKAEVEAFIRDSDNYQSCLWHLIDEKDKKGKPVLSQSDIAKLTRRADSNQAEKEAIGNGFNQLVKTVNARGG